MKKYIFIGVGGVLGTFLRYAVKNMQIYSHPGNLPVHTLAVNIVGSFILGLILTLAFEKCSIEENVRLGITTGFLGALTTFSTLCKETVALFASGDYFSAVLYIAASTILGLGAAYLGGVLMRKVICKYNIKLKKDDDFQVESEAE